MTRDDAGGDARWVEGTLEAGADPDSSGGRVPNPQTGVGLGAGKGSSFEPEEDAAADEPQADEPQEE